MDFISPWIQTTNLCNESCEYCFVKQNTTIMQTPVYMALEKLLIDSGADKIHLRFAGGEPLMVLKYWKDFAIRMLRNPIVSIEILTNLYQVPDDFWEIAFMDNVNISVSIDNGVRTKMLTRRVIDMLSKMTNPWIMTTLTDTNMAGIEELAEFIGETKYGWSITTDYFNKNRPNPVKVTERVMSLLSILRKHGYDTTRISFNNCSMNPNFSGCRAGREMFAVDCNGDIYQCQTVIGIDKKLGSVFSGYSPIDIVNKPGCTQCPIDYICKGWCPLHYKISQNSCVPMQVFSYLVIKENI